MVSRKPGALPAPCRGVRRGNDGTARTRVATVKKRRDSRQGVYLGITKSGRLYIGSVAGKGRSFDRRWNEHITELERGTHPNDGLRKDGADGLRFIPLAVVRRGDIEAARKIERILIRALRRSLTNER